MMVILFSATLLLSATLVFFIQPVVGKLLIPYLGGTPAVWNTCLVFFQGMLLLGYLYAHVLGKYFSRRIQLLFHLGMMLFVLLLLPLDFQKYIVMERFFHEPITWILRLLIIVVGLPFLIVTATAPLLQKWFSYANKDFGRDPYFLYSASNFGSLLALVSYPLIFEMFSTLATQQVLWRAGYWLLFFAVGVCGLFMIKGRQKDLAQDLVTEINENIDNKPGPLQKKLIISWILLAALPSSLVYGITDYLSTHVAAVPLFWVIPLILYLLTYILAFSKKHFYPGLLLQRLLGLGAIIVVITITLEITTPLLIVLPAHLITLFLAAFLCHGKLAKSRPGSEYLTEYYLLIAFGGFLGGIANAIIAPYVFKDVREYLIAIILVLLFRDSTVKKEAEEKTKIWKEFLYIGAVVFSGIFFLWIMKVLSIKRFEYSHVIVFGAPMLICYSYIRRPFRYVSGIIVLAVMALVFMSSIDRVIDTKRNFFGVAKVFDDNNGQFRFLIHGVTIHGVQALAGENRHEPFAYYGRKGPLGEVFEVYNEKKDVPGNIAVLGLGIGSIAAYGKEGQKWVFYEINPDIIKIAEDPELFSMLKGSSIKDTYKIFLGDARIRLQEADNSYFGLIFIDVFSSDYIPVHLLTREAMHLYLDKLSNNGILVFHVSSRYLNLAPIIAALAKDEQLVAYLKEDLRIGEKHIPGTLSSRWIIVARAERDLGKLAGSRENWRKINPIAGISSWTDQYSNIVRLFK